MNWEAVTALSTALTGFVIVATAIVGVNQLQLLRAQRRDAAAIELMRSLQDVTFAHAFQMIFTLPATASAAQVRAAGPEFEEAVQILAFRFETLGLLVYRDTISFEVMEDLMGGATMRSWDRLKDAIVETREKQSYPQYCEWFQWLAEQFEKRGRLQKIPAHIRYRDWVGPVRG